MSKPFLQHLHILCRDLQGMIDFWEKGLGAVFVEFRKFGPADGAVMEMNSVTRLYFKKVDCEPQDTSSPRAGVEHAGVVVKNLDATLALVKSMPHGKVTKEPFMSGPLRCAFISGPEGVIVEVMEEPA